MEHRWGRRCSVDVPLWLRYQADQRVQGRMRELSLSGAYIITVARAKVGQSLIIELDAGSTREQTTLAAWVIRQDAQALAIEWQEFAPWPVALILDGGAIAPDPPSGLQQPVGSSADRDSFPEVTALRHEP